MPRQKPYHKHLRFITATPFCQGKSLTTMTCAASPPRAKTKPYLPQAPAKYHRHEPRQKPYHKHLRSITTPCCAKTKNHATSTCEASPPRATRCAKTKTLPQAPAKYHRHAPRVLPRQNLTTSTRTVSPPRLLQDTNLTTSTCEASPPRATRCAKTKTLPQAPAKYHRHAPRVLPRQNLTTSTRTVSPPRLLQDTNLTTSTCEVSPPRAAHCAKTKTLPRAPAKYHHHAFCQDEPLTTSSCEESPPRATRCAKTKTVPQAPVKYHRNASCQQKSLATSTCEASPPRATRCAKTKTYHKHLRSITTTRFDRTKTLRKAPAKYHNYWFCQDTWEVSPPRILPRQYLPTSTCDIPPPRAMRCAKTKTLPQAPATYHRQASIILRALVPSTRTPAHSQNRPFLTCFFGTCNFGYAFLDMRFGTYNFWTCVWEHAFLHMHFWTCIYGSFWTCILGHAFLNMHSWNMHFWMRCEHAFSEPCLPLPLPLPLPLSPSPSPPLPLPPSLSPSLPLALSPTLATWALPKPACTAASLAPLLRLACMLRLFLLFSITCSSHVHAESTA